MRDSPTAALAERGAYLRRASAGSEGTLRIVANAPLSADARDLVAAVRSVAPDATLRTKREVGRSVTPARDLRNELHDRLTERQLAVLGAAYFAGYFERPRKSAGREPSRPGYRSTPSTDARTSVNGSGFAGATATRPGSNSTAPAFRSFGKWTW